MKKFLMLFILFSCLLFLVSCDNKSKSSFDDFMQQIFDTPDDSRIYKSDKYNIYIWTDTDTNVQYIIFIGCNKGGITPRLDSNGSPYIDNDFLQGGEHNEK